MKRIVLYTSLIIATIVCLAFTAIIVMFIVMLVVVAKSKNDGKIHYKTVTYDVQTGRIVNTGKGSGDYPPSNIGPDLIYDGGDTATTAFAFSSSDDDWGWGDSDEYLPTYHCEVEGTCRCSDRRAFGDVEKIELVDTILPSKGTAVDDHQRERRGGDGGLTILITVIVCISWILTYSKAWDVLAERCRCECQDGEAEKLHSYNCITQD